MPCFIRADGRMAQASAPGTARGRCRPEGLACRNALREAARSAFDCTEASMSGAQLGPLALWLASLAFVRRGRGQGRACDSPCANGSDSDSRRCFSAALKRRRVRRSSCGSVSTSTPVLLTETSSNRPAILIHKNRGHLLGSRLTRRGARSGAGLRFSSGRGAGAGAGAAERVNR